MDPLDNQIRLLCDRLVKAEGSELEQVIGELRSALEKHEHHRQTSKPIRKENPAAAAQVKT
jgi:hypothetical protein